jgi:cytoskeleton-associated protein 5
VGSRFHALPFVVDWLVCYVLILVYEPIKGIKAPKAQQEALMWINSAVLDFGIEGLQLKDLVECIKQGLGNSAQPVRTTAISIIATLATFMGQGSIDIHSRPR